VKAVGVCSGLETYLLESKQLLTAGKSEINLRRPLPFGTFCSIAQLIQANIKTPQCVLPNFSLLTFICHVTVFHLTLLSFGGLGEVT
jgi:hypothetical protein